MPEKELLKKSGFYSVIILFAISIFWLLFSIQTSFGYSGTGTTQDLKSGSRLNGDLLAQPLNGSVTIYFGTQSTQGTGTTGYIGTNTAGLPFLRYSFLGGSSSINFNGFGAVCVDSVAIPSTGSLSTKLDAVDGVGTNNTFNNTTLAGQGTITANFGVNGLDISPLELSMVDGAVISLNTATGSITNHTHTGSDGTTQIAHDNVIGTGANSHAILDNFISSKAAASGVASLDTNTLVVQNPASGTSTPGVNKTVMSDGTSKILDGWLSDNVTKMGTPTTDNISEGSTNKYYTDGRVSAAVGSLSVNSFSDVSIVFNENDFVKISGGLLVSGSSTVTVAFPEVTGSATASQLPLISNISGSITSNQLPTVLQLAATTTTTLSGTTTSGRLFNHQGQAYTDGSTTAFTDSSSYARTLTPIGGVNMSTTQKQFGLRGGSFDGTGDYITAPDSTDWNFGTGDITWETFLYPTAVGGTNGTRYWSTDETASTGFLFYTNDGVTTFNIITYGGGGSTPTTTGTYTVNAWTHLAFVRVGTSSVTKIYINGVASATGTYTGSSADAGDKFNIGHWDISGADFQGYFDETRVSNIARYTGDSFVVPTSPFVSDANTLLLLHYETADVNYFTDVLAYVTPGTTSAFLNIISNGTASDKIEMVLGTETPFGSTTTHILQAPTGSRVLFGFYDAFCFEESKDIIEVGTSVQDEAYAIAKRVSIVKSHPIIPGLKVGVEDAKNAAREDYLQLFRKSDIETYKKDRVAEYTTDVAGSASVNLDKLNFEAQAYHDVQRQAEFEVLPDLNERIKTKRKMLESDKNITSISIIADDPSTDDLLKGADSRTVSIGNQVGVLFGAFQKQVEEISSLTAALENQKIAHNEEVDNLYTLINAIIVALIAIGGVGGWTTMRKKRKGA